MATSLKSDGAELHLNLSTLYVLLRRRKVEASGSFHMARFSVGGGVVAMFSFSSKKDWLGKFRKRILQQVLPSFFSTELLVPDEV